MFKRRKLELDELEPELRRTIEAVICGDEVSVLRGGEEIGQLGFRSSILDGEIVVESRLGRPKVEVPEGVTVVVTAMALSKSAPEAVRRIRRRLYDLRPS